MTDPAGVLPGTLDLLPLKAVSLGELQIPQGGLDPALSRPEHQALIASRWGTSDHNRRAKFYALTALGRRRLWAEMASWSRMVAAMARSSVATPQEVR